MLELLLLIIALACLPFALVVGFWLVVGALAIAAGLTMAIAAATIAWFYPWQVCGALALMVVAARIMEGAATRKAEQPSCHEKQGASPERA